MSCTCTPAEDYAESIQVGPLVKGDEWDGRTLTIWVNNVDYDNTLARTDTDKAPGTGANPKWVAASNGFSPMTRVVMQVHTSETSLDTLVDLDSDDSEITISDATDWVFVIEPYTFTLDAGTYFVAIACENTEGGWKTFFKGTLILTGQGVIPT